MSLLHRRLIAVWATLMALTVAMAVAADVTHASRLGVIWLIVIAIVTIAKVRLVLGDYLGLRRNRACAQWHDGCGGNSALHRDPAAFIAIRP